MHGKSVLIGLTGGIGTGKTRVSNLLRDLGAAVVCSDAIVHELQQPGAEGLAGIVEAFGPEMLTADGSLDRPRLGSVVFNDPEARRRLNGIIHPLVGRETARQIAEHVEAGAPVIVLDIPLLFETRRPGSGGAYPTDQVVVVYAPESTQLQRVMDRDGLKRDEALARIQSQIPIEEKRERADVVVDNSGDWHETEQQVRDLYRAWTRTSRSLPPGEAGDLPQE